MNLLGIGKKLIDPRTYDKKVNQGKKVRALKWWEDDTMSPAIPEVKSIEEYVQKGKQVPVVSSIVDRSKTDSLITNINDVELSRPVSIQGGTNFMFKYPDWLFANQEAIARRHLNTAKTLEEQFGVPPLFAPNLMAPTGSDFMTGSAELAMSHAFETLDAASKRELDDFIRKKGFDVPKKRKLANGKEETYLKNYKLEDWHGIDDPRSIDQLRNAPADLRKEIVKRFGTKNFFGPEGFLTPGEIRTMITQDDLMNARDSTFTNIGVFNTAGDLTPSNHWSYSHMFPGQGDARLIEAGNIGIYDFDTILKAGKGGKIVPFTKSDGTLRKPIDPRNPSSDDLTAVGKNITIGILDEAQLEKWKDLGIVGVPGLTLAALGSSSLASEPKLPEFLDRINNPQDNPYIINPDGSISTHRMAAEQSSSGNWYVFPTIQKMPDGTLKEFLLPDGTPDNYSAMKYAIATNNILQMKDKDSAIAYAEGSYKTGTPLESFDPMKLQSEDYMNARLNNNYAEVREAPRGPISGMLADAFMGAKEYLNEMPNVAEFFKEAFGKGFGAEIAGAQGRAPTSENVNVPLGDIMLGETPEAINELSYGLTPSAEQGLDLALTAGGGLPVAAKGVIKAGKSLVPKFLEMSEDFARKTGGLLDVTPPGPRGPEMAPRSDLGFYSAVEQAALNLKRNQGSGQSFLNEINKQPNVKDDEIKWIGLDEFLQNKNKVTKQEIQDYIANNRVDIQEIKLEPKFLRQDRDERTGLPRLIYPDGRVETFMNLTDLQEADAAYFRTGGGTKYAEYQLPGGKNYRELLLTMPNDPSYKGKHWSQPNVLAHLRVNDRVDAEGNKVLLLEEVQSDWHQSGRDQGYGPRFKEFFEAYYETEDGQRVVIGAGYTKEEAKASIDPGWKPILNDSIKYKTRKEKVNDGIPDAPMKDTWYQMALKRALKLAADEGYDRLALTTGARQADRYDLSKQVESIRVNYINNQNGGRTIDIRGISPLTQRDQHSYKLMVDKDGKITDGILSAKQFEGKNISEVIGKEAADKIMKLDQGGVLSGVDLKIGGKGMKKYYDETYPKFLEKYGKKWNAKTGKTKVNIARDGSSISELVTYIDITPEMRGGIKQKGQPLFSAAPFVGSGLLSDDQQDQNNFGLLN